MLWYVYYGVCIEGGSNAKKRLVMQEACMGGSGGGQLKEKKNFHKHNALLFSLHKLV